MCSAFDLLKYYWEVERPCFLKQLESQSKEAPQCFKTWWIVIGSE